MKGDDKIYSITSALSVLMMLFCGAT